MSLKYLSQRLFDDSNGKGKVMVKVKVVVMVMVEGF